MFSTGYYIARRIYKKDTYQGKISSPVLKIAVSAVALGVMIMLVALSTGIGLQKEIQDNIASFSGHVNISPLTYGSHTSKGMSLHQDFYPKFPAVPQVQTVYPYALTTGVIKTSEDFESIVLKGLGEDYSWDRFSSFLTQGKIPRYGTGEINDSIIISTSTASALRLNVGDRIKAYFMRDGAKTPLLRYYTVAALYKTDISEFDEVYAIGDIRSVQHINAMDSTTVSGFEIVLDHLSSLAEAAPQIFVETQGEYQVSTIADAHGVLLDWVAMFDVNIWVIIVIMTIVCAVNMITVLLILILEKTSLIGLLKSMGADNVLVSKIFLWNGFYIILRGLLIGNAIALLLLWAQDTFSIVTLDADVYSVDSVPVYFHWWGIALLNVGVVVVSMLMLLLPAAFISKINPAKTIRYQ